MDCCAGRRGDQDNPVDDRRQGCFTILVKESFLSELLFELLEENTQLTGTVKVNGIDNQLVAAAGFVDTDPAIADDLLSLPELSCEPAPLVFKKHCRELGLLILESEIGMAGERLPDSRHFPAHPDETKFVVEQSTDLGIDLRN